MCLKNNFDQLFIQIQQINFAIKFSIQTHKTPPPFPTRPRARSSRMLRSHNHGLIYREAEQAVTYGN